MSDLKPSDIGALLCAFCGEDHWSSHCPYRIDVEARYRNATPESGEASTCQVDQPRTDNRAKDLVIFLSGVVVGVAAMILAFMRAGLL